MNWLGKFLPSKGTQSPANVNVSYTRSTLVLRIKCDTTKLEVCVPTEIRRERPLGREDKVDIVHVLPDGSLRHTPIP